MPPLLVADGTYVPVMQLVLTNPSGPGSGDLDLTSLTVGQPADETKQAQPVLGELVSAFRLRSGEDIVADRLDLPPDATAAVLEPNDPLTMAAGQDLPVVLELKLRDGVQSGQLRLALEADGIVARQGGTNGLAVQVSAVQGQTFPFWTQVGNLGSLDFATSFINFPNPFAAGQEATRFSYVLPSPGRVSLRILTPHGRVAVVLLRDEHRTSGLHQTDVWSGLNGLGRPVHNGVYLAELRVEYEDGSHAKALRKVGVVR